MATVVLPGRGDVAYQWTGNGPETVVLVNGSVFNYHQWDKQALPILQRGLGERFRFLQYDYVGIGGSSAKTVPFRMSDLAEELCDLLDALSVEQVHLLGISKGSLVGQAFLIAHRDRVRSFCGLGNPNVLSRDLASTFAGFQERIEALTALQHLWPQRIDRDNYAPLFNAVYVPALFGKRRDELALGERVRAWLVRRMVYPALEGTYIQTMVDLFRYYVGDIAQEISFFSEGLPKVRGVPVLLLNGTADTTTPVGMSRDLVRVLPGAELVEFEGVTHMGPMLLKKEAEPVFGRYVDFLKRETCA
ncbi:MAG TPA: alpha/beta hydrolase [Anaerolineae bacterium]|nr:alpha/beta hydrolase [Anaerolineae bacterium]